MFTYTLSHRRQTRRGNVHGAYVPQHLRPQGYGHPEHGLLLPRGVVLESELLRFKQLNPNGNPALTVVKNGRTTGMTMGCVSSLKSLVRHYDYIGIGID